MIPDETPDDRLSFAPRDRFWAIVDALGVPRLVAWLDRWWFR